ncbi:MHYT domain-containing protein [Chthonobacter rhizosphaerae]|uniref:MHYT domain-containing protein n=1 Tax=Chthonobacter rhizosphaerae TaxID=2735553 RepID=UPI0015EFC288|nr:MHYT domain-containing protein [Chthonobacter rhizosphaerae]
MSPSHEPWLVALSLLVAFQGSYVGLNFARGIENAGGIRRRHLITMASLSLALGIWTMHFVGMLAAHLPVAVDFLVLPTLVSFLVCVLVVGVAVVFVGSGRPSARRITIAALFMGAGIVTMHYLGMSALHTGLHMDHDPLYVAASALIGVGASGAALWFAFGAHDRAADMVPAAIMAAAIAAMHYTAMAGTEVHVMVDGVLPGQPTFSHGILAVVVSVVAFLVSGLFLLTLVPEQVDEPGEAIEIAPPPAEQTDGDRASDPAPSALRLPVEKDGIHRTLEIARLMAVQAQGHYTQLFDGEAVWFCPLAISDVEAQLDPAAFVRIHRSHIVRLHAIVSMHRAGDAATVLLSTKVPYRVPVARSRKGWLKDLLRSRTVAA